MRNLRIDREVARNAILNPARDAGGDGWGLGQGLHLMFIVASGERGRTWLHGVKMEIRTCETCLFLLGRVISGKFGAK